ncbi:unnamed protein product [Rangifer tarandus platyrhynchus]|uniref:Uncharacterized protein n=1 Tax=Rangifer tarandus platyrhynchus TaxID=3082113 RepID=A0ABN8Z0K5_RANTA|nr:unnamed protein product [Rangifer tarandus platyrhynchus]
MACVLPGQEPVSACGGRAPSAFRDPYGPQSTGAGGAEGAAQPLHPVRDSRQELHNDASILSTFAAPDPPGRRKCRSRGVTHRPPHTEWAPMYVPPAPRAPPAVPGPLVPQTRTPRLHILGPTGFLIQKPRQLATQIGSPHPFRFLRALSVWVWVSQTSSGASVCSHRDPCADHGLPASVSPASFHRGLPPALGTGHTAISLPRLSPGCRVSEAVDPVPLQCPHVHPPQGSQGHASDAQVFGRCPLVGKNPNVRTFPTIRTFPLPPRFEDSRRQPARCQAELPTAQPEPGRPDTMWLPSAHRAALGRPGEGCESDRARGTPQPAAPPKFNRRCNHEEGACWGTVSTRTSTEHLLVAKESYDFTVATAAVPRVTGRPVLPGKGQQEPHASSVSGSLQGGRVAL